MARPLLINGKLPMHIFKNCGYRYAGTCTSVRKADGSYNGSLEKFQAIPG